MECFMKGRYYKGTIDLRPAGRIADFKCIGIGGHGYITPLE
jgi:hypothetical protein